MKVDTVWMRGAGRRHAFVLGMVAITVGGLLTLTGCGGGSKADKVLMKYVDDMANGRYDAATKLVYREDAEVMQTQAGLVEFTKNSPDDSIFTRCDWTISKDAALKKAAEAVMKQGGPNDPEIAETLKDCELVVTIGTDKKDKSVQKKVIWMVKAGKVIPTPIPLDN